MTLIHIFLQGLPICYSDFTADLRSRMRKVCRNVVDRNPMESDNELVTYHSWFACPLLDLQADSRTRVRNPPSGVMEMATVTSVPVLLFTMRCLFFFTVKTCLYALSEESTLSFSYLSANPFLCRPLIFNIRKFHMPCLVKLSLVFFLNGTINSGISFRTLRTIFLAGEDQKQIN